jgi:hypothetical protein
MDDRGSIPAGAAEFLSLSPHPDLLWGPPTCLYSAYHGDLSPGVKRPGHEVDHSPSPSAEIKNAWSYTLTPPIRLHCVVLRYMLCHHEVVLRYMLRHHGVVLRCYVFMEWYLGTCYVTIEWYVTSLWHDT